MASFDLVAFEPIRDIQLVGALEAPSVGIIKLGFWVTDPNQSILWNLPAAGHPRRDFLWERTCFEVFIGIQNEDFYREVNLSDSTEWQVYAFEEYGYPESMPPLPAQDIELVALDRTKFGLTCTLDINPFLHHHQVKMNDVFIGLSAVIATPQKQHLFAMQHSGRQPDFHNKRDWLYQG